MITALRDGHPHVSRFVLSRFKPAEIFCGIVTGSPSKGDRVIHLTNVGSWHITDLDAKLDGITLLVGTSEGDGSISKRRYRYIAGDSVAGRLTLDENAVTWVNGQYVTAYKNWEFWPIYPYILPNKPYTFYKDRDIVYSDQNDHMPPVAKAKGPFCGYLDGASKVFNLDASGSYPMAAGATLNPATSYLWESDGGIIDDPTAITTFITFNTAYPEGCWLHLTVTDSNSKSQTIHTPIFVHARSGADAPITDFSISNELQNDWKSGGANMSVEVWDKNVLDDTIDGAYFVLWKESYYAGVENYYGTNANIQFAGYARMDENITRSPKAGTVTFDLCTIEGIMDFHEMPSISLEESSSTATWYGFPTNTLTVARAVHHYWKWHSTLFSIADVTLPINLTDTLYACDDFELGQMYVVVGAFTRQYSVFAGVCCDCAGRVYVEQDINMLNSTDRASVPLIMDLEEVDRRIDTDVTFVRNDQKASCVTVSGTHWDGSKYAALMSACPGDMYSDMGVNVVGYERLVLHDQAHANFLSGRLFSLANQDVLEVNMSLAGDYPVDVVPQTWWTLKDMDTKREAVDLENSKAVPRHVSYHIDLLNGAVYPEVTFEPEAVDMLGDGVTIAVPVDPTQNNPNPSVDPSPNIPISITTIGRFGWSYDIGDGTYPIPTGCIGIIEIPYGATPDSVKIVAKPGTSGTISIDIWKCTYLQIAAGVHPVVGDSICGAHKVAMIVADKAVIDLSDWIKTWSINDQLFLINENVTTLTLVAVEISGVAKQ